MLKKNFIFLLLLLLSSCGYEAIHSKKNSINESQKRWPTVSKEDLMEDEIIFVVQIDGKKRAILNIKRDVNEEEVLEKIKINQDLEKFLKDKKIKKSIFVPNRLINIIL